MEDTQRKKGKPQKLFEYGTRWLKADMHLHTISDKEFKYTGQNENDFQEKYIDALCKANISIGVITNHNKFNHNEYRYLRKRAFIEGILLLPGMELSINDGANGIHTLIVFSDEWLQDECYIKQFLCHVFTNISPDKYENNKALTTTTLLETIKILDEFQKDYFLIFAHIEQDKGLLNELKGGRFSELAVKKDFQQRTLGFQKVCNDATRDKIKLWSDNWYPAEVEGSDPKNIEEIGKTRPCYLKIGDLSYEAVKFALIDYQNRVLNTVPPKYTHSFIQRISFEGGVLDGESILFSPELNTFIGIRGSGKSSVLESLRYALNLKLEKNDSEMQYKTALVAKTLGSGGKIVLDVMNQYGQQYQIKRIYKDAPNVYLDGIYQSGLSICETVLNNPLFFGQKELAASEQGSVKALIEKMLGAKCDEIRKQIADQGSKITNLLDKIHKIDNFEEQIEIQKKIIENAKHKLEFYKAHNLEEKLQRRLNFDTDIRHSRKGIEKINVFMDDTSNLIATHEDDLRNFIGYKSKENTEYFSKYDEHFLSVINCIDMLKSQINGLSQVLSVMKQEHNNLINEKTKLADEFASIERKLSEELKTTDKQNISTDEFLEIKTKIDNAQNTLSILQKNSKQKKDIINDLIKELTQLSELWYKEFKIIEGELKNVSERNSALKFMASYRDDKAKFKEFMKYIFKGSGIRDTVCDIIASEYSDFIGIYKDIDNVCTKARISADLFKKYFMENINNLLLFQTPNTYSIIYRGTPLDHHSLGQRASALILFVLGQKENDIIIIDQPEDDLDNQTIYEDVIKLFKQLKPNIQFIFATHNPNIPVLGDAEMIHCCEYKDDKIEIESGSIDNPTIQKNIVTVMEGGKDAFQRRKEIYRAWKS